MFLLTALIATIAAIIYPTDEGSDVVGYVQPIREKSAVVDKNLTTQPATSVDKWLANDEDPFAPRSWQAAAPEPDAARAIVPLVAEAAPPPPALPLPYAFVGQMADGSNRVVYLNRGEQLLLARTGEVLEGTYKVVQITASQIEFETVATGLRQVLPIPVQD